MKRRVRKLSEKLQEMLDVAAAKEKRKAKKKRRVEGVLRCGCPNGKKRAKQILKALVAENTPLPYYEEKNMASGLQVETYKQEATDREVGELIRTWNPKKGTLKYKKTSEAGMYQVWYTKK